ncbi:MAG: fructosamine kinase family protein [Solirubrobacteraceae bacterium]
MTPFVKSRPVPLPGEYATEAAGLRWLGEAGVPVRQVLEASNERLVLERIAPAPTDPEELGRTVARMHQAGATAFGALPPGAPGPFRIAAAEFPAGESEDWPSFYAQHRLLPLVRHAPSVERVCERIADLAGPREPPSRLHGDLWGGNIVGNHLIDPAAHGGHREIDLAMLRLFGWPGERFLAAYEEVAPLAEGWRDRVDLYQLLPLLVHAELFGGGYGASAERAARRYAG